MSRDENEELAQQMTYDAMLDMFFERWFRDYSAQHSINIDLFKGVLREAFKSGWIKCEEFYS